MTVLPYQILNFLFAFFKQHGFSENSVCEVSVERLTPVDRKSERKQAQKAVSAFLLHI